MELLLAALPIEYWRVSSPPDGSIDWKQIEDIVPTLEVFDDGLARRTNVFEGNPRTASSDRVYLSG
jgi:hypothetical protein